MLRSFTALGIVVSLVWLTAHFWPWREVRHAPGVLVGGDPVQTDIPPMALQPIEGYAIQAVALYDITSRILRTKHYPSGPGSDLVPIDVAVSWGRMSDQAVLDRLSISQGNRFFFYEWEDSPPLPKDEMIAHAANMHLIAANSRVAGAIRGLHGGQVATMHGYLVNVTGEDGFHWNTSLSRTDTGRGACELFYVEAIHEEAVDR